MHTSYIPPLVLVPILIPDAFEEITLGKSSEWSLACNRAPASIKRITVTFKRSMPHSGKTIKGWASKLFCWSHQFYYHTRRQWTTFQMAGCKQ